MYTPFGYTRCCSGRPAETAESRLHGAARMYREIRFFFIFTRAIHNKCRFRFFRRHIVLYIIL